MNNFDVSKVVKKVRKNSGLVDFKEGRWKKMKCDIREIFK